jgi:Fe-S-cluster containining protein
MDGEPSDSLEAGAARVKLQMEAGDLEMQVELPRDPVALDQLLPLAQGLADGLVTLGVAAEQAEGRSISCRAGCGACCRQIVPIAEVEARRIGRLVDEMPDDRRAAVESRFAKAREQLAISELLETLERRDDWRPGESREVGTRYFRESIACPFLEHESCSIHPDRPIACREYLVTSPAENCAAPTAETVKCVKLPASVWNALARFDAPRGGGSAIRWVPLVLALSWARENTEEPPARPAPELLRELIDRVTRSGQTPAIARAPDAPDLMCEIAVERDSMRE